MIAVVLAAWVLAALVLAFVVGAAIRIADARRDRPAAVDDDILTSLVG